MTEYMWAREEVVSSVSNQHLALTFGTASLVGLLVAGLTNWKSSVGAAALLAVPLVAAWILTMWCGEVVRMLRSVQFCGEVARIINTELTHPQPQVLN